MLLNGLTSKSLITNNSLSSVFVAMDMAILLEIVRKKSEEELEKEKAYQWTQVQKVGTSKHDNRMKGKGINVGNGAIPIEKKYFKPQVVEKATASSNPFVVLSPSDD